MVCGLVTGFPLVDEPFAGFFSNMFLESLCGLPLYSNGFSDEKILCGLMAGFPLVDEPFIGFF
jgi:hypothetical protein